MNTVAGDPCKLAAIGQKETDTEPFMFETLTWRQTVCGAWGTIHVLAGAHRQARDLQLLHVLRRVRVGDQTDADIALLNETSVGVSNDIWDKHTQVRGTNVAVTRQRWGSTRRRWGSTRRRCRSNRRRRGSAQRRRRSTRPGIGEHPAATEEHPAGTEEQPAATE